MGSLLPTSLHRAFLLLFALTLSSLAQAHDAQTGAGGESVDTEHIFGFAEGADIGEKGERELEFTATGLVGKIGQYVGVTNETAFRYGVADGFRASIGLLTDYHAISGVPDLSDLHALNVFSGVSSEFRWQFLNRFSSPVDLTVSFEPYWRHIDDSTGQNILSYVAPVKLLIDIPLVPEKTFAAFNLSYTSEFMRDGGAWRQANPVEISLAASTAIAPGVFLGVEVRQLALNQHGFFSGTALFAGPSLYAKLSESVSVKVAWSGQIPAETGGRVDLGNYERQEARATLAIGF